jgi:hypothetical protein
MDLRRTQKWVMVAWLVLGTCLGGAAAASRPIPFVDGSWTLVVLPDTQFYAMTYPDIFRSQTRWIADHKEEQNIVFVLHEGDLTNTNSPEEWEATSLAMSTLDAAAIPYALVSGNHDYEENAATRETLINSYFPLSRFAERSTFGGVYEPRHIENSYHLFDAGAKAYVVLALEFGPRDGVLSWASRVLLQHADRTAIIVTHAYTYSDGTRLDHVRRPWQINNPHSYGVADLPGGVNDGQEIWDKLLAGHEKTSLVFSGHISPGNARQTRWGLKGNTVHEILANYQIRPLGGEGYLRLIEFLPDGNTIQVLTYSPFLDLYLTDGDNQFTLPLNAILPPDIKVNGQDIPVLISQGDAISVTVGLTPAEYAGFTADWWIAVHTPFAAPGDWYTYVHPTGWMPGVNLCAQAALFDLAPFEVLEMALPVGNYTFYFAVDPPDGIPTAELVDSVEVQVE